MRFIVNKIPEWVRKSIQKEKSNIDINKYLVMTEDTEEHVGFMKERNNENGEKYFEIIIFEPEVEKEILLFKHYKKRNN